MKVWKWEKKSRNLSIAWSYRSNFFLRKMCIFIMLTVITFLWKCILTKKKSKKEWLLDINVKLCDRQWPLRSNFILWKNCVFIWLVYVESFIKIGLWMSVLEEIKRRSKSFEVPEQRFFVWDIEEHTFLISISKA